MTGTLDPAEILAIQWDCEQLIRRYALLNDLEQHEAVAALFTEDAAFARPSDPDKRIVGRDAILAMFRGRKSRLGRHFISNSVITVDSADAASAVSYVILYVASQTAEPGKLPKADPGHAIGAFHDRFVRTGEGWRFAERIGSMVMTT